MTADPDPPPPAPLRGVRVVDFSRYLPGPFCTLQLAWLGAEVTTVEQPAAGEPMRQVPPLGPDGQSLASASLMRGKRQLLADLSDPEQQGRVLELCATADVVVESFRPGVATRLGIGYGQVSAANSRVVYCSLSGYGQDGPWAQRAGHDANYESVAGLLHRTGPPEQPCLPPVPAADLAGGSLAATAICAALYEAQRTGSGRHIDISLTEAALAWQAHSLPSAGEQTESRGRGLLTGGLACYSLYRCADGEHVAVAAIEPKFFARVCELVGSPDLAARQYEPAAQGELHAALAGIFATQDAEHWHELLSPQETCVTRVAPVREVVEHPQLVARGAVEQLHGQARYPAPASPFVFDGHRTRQTPTPDGHS